jgi:TusA-related sulfurtransferase
MVTGGPGRRTAKRWPQALLDAGGASGATLVAALDRSVRDLAPGQVLEVVSKAPAAAGEVRAWCRRAGHALRLVRRDGFGLQCWIAKRPRRWRQGMTGDRADWLARRQGRPAATGGAVGGSVMGGDRGA